MIYHKDLSYYFLIVSWHEIIELHLDIKTIYHCHNTCKIFCDAKGQQHICNYRYYSFKKVCCTCIICLTRAMFTNIDTRNSKKIYHCHKL